MGNRRTEISTEKAFDAQDFFDLIQKIASAQANEALEEATVTVA